MIGFDIGGTKCAVCIGKEVDGELQILAKKVIPTDHSVSPYEMIDRMCGLLEEMKTELCPKEEADLSQDGDPVQQSQKPDGAKLAAFMDVIGISCGGPLDSRTGVIMSPPNLPGWDNVKIVTYLQEKYGMTSYLQNDANACAVAEWKYGAGKGCENMIFLTFGTGMGAGLILNGRLYAGTNDMAGEIGHVRISDYGPVGYGKAGSFEGFCSGNGLAQIGQMIAREKLQMGGKVSFCESLTALDQITAKGIAEAANNGAEDALLAYRICGEMLGKGLSILIDVLNPEKIVLGSVFQRSGHLLRESMQKVIDRECLTAARSVCTVVPALLEENIGDYAALAVAAIGGK